LPRRAASLGRVTVLPLPATGLRAGARAGLGAATALALLAAVVQGPGAQGAPANPAPPRAAEVRGASVSALLAQLRAEPAPATLINVWATWCDPCREELPDLLRFHRAHRDAGLRLMLLSADDEDASDAIGKALADAMAKGGLTPPLDLVSYRKQDDDMQLIDALDPRWSGALPATFLFDRKGRRIRSWLAPVTFDELEREVAPRLTKPRADAKRSPSANPKPEPSSSREPPRRKP
jgi:thiol-disulfide isomerase/thioredoxin